MNYDYFKAPIRSDRLSHSYGNTPLRQPRVFALRPLVWQAVAVMAVGCALVLGGLAVTP